MMLSGGGEELDHVPNALQQSTKLRGARAGELSLSALRQAAIEHLIPGAVVKIISFKTDLCVCRVVRIDFVGANIYFGCDQSRVGA
jgi:hypothetical protein